MGKKHRRESHSQGSGLAQALALHRAGRLAEAENLYRSLAGNPKAVGYLGVLLCQLNRGEEGHRYLHSAVQLAPDDSELLANLAVAEHEAGRFNEALSFVERALKFDPGNLDLLDKRGFILQDLGRHEEALKSFEVVLQSDPNHADAQFHAGNSFQAMGEFSAAEKAFRKVVELRPTDDEAWTNLGNALFEQLNAEEAATAHRRAIEIRPTADAYHNLAISLSGLGQQSSAIAAARSATQLAPKVARHFYLLGSLQNAFKQTEGAIASFRRACELAPEDEEAHIRLIACLNQEGRHSEAAAEFQSIENPTPAARMVRSILVPIIPQSVEEIESARASVMEHLRAIELDAPQIADPAKEVALTNFYWSYHSEGELPMQRQAVATYAATSPNLFWTSPRVEVRKKGKVRLGVVSALLHRHTIGKLFLPLISALPNADLEVVMFDCSRAMDDWTQKLNASVDRSYKLAADLKTCREFIADQDLDAIFYPEIGMDPLVYYLAFSRLAPVQFMTWGHPVSTALPNMDYFLSSVDLETPGSESQYSERLVQLPSLMTVFERPECRPIGRSDLGLPEDKRLYVCPQSLFKIHPDMDAVFGEILSTDEKGLLVFLTGNERHWDELLMARFRKSIPEVAERTQILRRLNLNEYIGLCDLANVVLDTFYFGGGNSSLEAFSVGAPIVTLPGSMLRGRITYAEYRAMGMMDLVAESAESYTKKALEIAHNPDLRESLRRKILDRNAVLYDNHKPVSELRDFVHEQVRR
ncbi:MAG TPA: tetratricopeptide repeat protein [Fimbriimonadaceae bacterium]|nr:tetratricopeptide repeat protein [Fimbriimonadaceae bacterium]